MLAFRGEYFQAEGRGKSPHNMLLPQQIISENSILELKHKYSWIQNLGVSGLVTWSKNRFKGFENRYEWGWGFSYDFIKSDDTYLFTEQGYLFRTETAYIPGPSKGPQNNSHLWRSYFEAYQRVNETLSGKVGGELKLGVDNIEDLEIHIEPSLEVLLSRNVSFAFSYKYSFDNLLPKGVIHHEDHIYMTHLRAKF